MNFIEVVDNLTNNVIFINTAHIVSVHREFGGEVTQIYVSNGECHKYEVKESLMKVMAKIKTAYIGGTGVG